MTPLSRATVLEGGRENFLRERRCVARRSRRLPWRVTFSERSLRLSLIHISEPLIPNPEFQSFHPGDDLLSHKAALAVPSALEDLTSVFGMGTGVAPPV